MSKKYKANNLKKSTGTASNVKVSVVVPCCNVEKYIEQCLESIVKQTLKDIEIICINDGSKDKTLSIIQKYAQNDNRIKILDKPNSGYGDSMNKGFSIATGEYIGIVESDDFIEPEMFETLYNTAKKNNADIVKSNFWFYWSSPEKNELHEYFHKEECDIVIKPSEYDNGSLFGRKPSIWSAIYKRSYIEKREINFLPTPGASFQDTSFTFKVYSTAERMVCLYDAFLHYRQDNENSSVNNADKKAYCICDEYKEIERYISKDKEKFYPIYGAAFYDSCIWMYERLGIKKKYEFLKHISPWFKCIINEIGVEALNFGEAWWKYRDIARIANDPYEYHMWRNVERYEQMGHTFTYELPTTKLNNFKDVQKKQQNKKQTPFFSVIVPVYNNEMYLHTCLDSLLFQSFENFEVICINDGSKDHSLSILEEYAKLDKRLIIVNQKNSGPSRTRNVGIKLARGKYILFLDSDDYYSENTCERIYKEIESRKKIEAVVFGTEIFPIEPRASEWHYYILTTPDIYHEKIDEKLLLTKPYLKIYSWRCCFKRSFLEKNNIIFNTDFKYGEDAMFVFEAMLKITGISVISDKLYNYRHFNKNSLMNQITKDHANFAKYQIRILEEMLKISKKNSLNASTELFEYACDFIYGSIDTCPSPEREECILDFIRIIRSNRLEKYADFATNNCKGFWDYCCTEETNYKNRKKLKTRFVMLIRKILPPSKQAFYDYSIQISDYIRKQQNSIYILQEQITELQKQNQEIKRYCYELTKQYNEGKF